MNEEGSGKGCAKEGNSKGSDGQGGNVMGFLTMGRPPEERMPRLRDSISWGTLAWQGLKAEKVLVMPIMGRDTVKCQVVLVEDSLVAMMVTGRVLCPVAEDRI